jgi:hypothetical protein
MPSRRPLVGGRDRERGHEFSEYEERTGRPSRQGYRLALRGARWCTPRHASEGCADRRRSGCAHGGERGHIVSTAADRADLVKPRRTARGHETAAPVALTAAVDRNRRLSEGALVQASVRARLLGIPLLRLDATVMLMPAAITASSSAVVAGNGLAEAVRSINDGAEVLAQARRDGRH